MQNRSLCRRLFPYCQRQCVFAITSLFRHDGSAEQIMRYITKQAAQLWQRERAKFDTFLINVKRYSQNHTKNCIFVPLYRATGAI